ncbi:MAG: nuclear transport factor 2 family protein [Acidimicrobiales bacterium]
MDDRGQIENLMSLYCRLYDSGDFEGYAQLFADARVVGPLSTLHGSAEVVEYHRSNCLLYDGSPQTRHVTTNIEIDVADDGQTARARSYVTVYQALPDFPLQAIFVGGYIDEFAKNEGAWQFSERQAVPYFVGDLSRHAREFLSSTAE